MPKNYSIVGMNFIHTEEIVAALKPGTPVVLVREPRNVHDTNAIAVWVGGSRVGYIPRKQNAALAQFIDQQPLQRLALDSSSGMTGEVNAIDATFIRSPNSGYPQVEI